MGDPGNENEVFGVVHGVDDAVIANPDAEVIPPGKLHRAWRARVNREVIDCSGDTIVDRSTEPAVRLARLWVEADVVSLSRCYLRTFDQGTARSTSSRACSAARLSSRYSARSTMARYCSTSMRTAASRPRLETKRTSSLERS